MSGGEWRSRLVDGTRPRLPRPYRWWRWPVVVGMIVAGGCGATESSGAPLPPGPTVIPVKLKEYSFDYRQPVPAGRAVFELLNTGTVRHQLRVFLLPEDVPPIDEQLRGSERRIVEPIASVPNLAPGETASVAVDLFPGQRYALLCFIREADGMVHAQKGMASEFRAGSLEDGSD